MRSSESLTPHEAIAELAGVDFQRTSMEQLLGLVAELAKKTVPGADEVSVTLVRRDRPSTPTATGDLARLVDEHQYEVGYGPCLDAAQGGGVLVISDMRTERRWPEYTPRAVDAGVLSSLSVGLPLLQDVSGALNIYSLHAEAFDHEATQLAVRFAGYAAVAVANAARYAEAADQARQMREAMASRAVIEQAKGMLMLLHNCDADEAFAHLIRASQHTQRKLRDVAAEVVTKGPAATATGPRPSARTTERA